MSHKYRGVKFHEEHLPGYLGGTLPQGVKEQRQILQPVFGYSTVVSIPATKGDETVSTSGIFENMSQGFRIHGFNVPCHIATSCRRVVFGRQIQDRSAGQILRVVRGINGRILTQNQVVAFFRRFAGIFPEKQAIYLPVTRDGRVVDDLSNVFFVRVIGTSADLVHVSNMALLRKEQGNLFGYLYI